MKDVPEVPKLSDLEEYAVEWEYLDKPTEFFGWGDRGCAEKESRNYRNADLKNGRTTGRIARLAIVEVIDLREDHAART